MLRVHNHKRESSWVSEEDGCDKDKDTLNLRCVRAGGVPRGLCPNQGVEKAAGKKLYLG